MNKKIILPIAFLSLLGFAINAGADDQMTIGGRTPKRAKETPAKTEVKKSSPTYESLEGMTVNDRELCTFTYYGTKPDGARQTLEDVYEIIRSTTGKNFDKAKWINSMITAYENKNKDLTMMLTNMGYLYAKGNKDHYFYIDSAPDVAISSPTAVAKKIKYKAPKSTEAVTRNDIILGVGYENNNRTLNMALRIWGKLWVDTQFDQREQSLTENIVTQTGKRFNAYGRTSLNKTEDIRSYGAYFDIPTSKKIGFIVGGEHYETSAKTVKSVEERITDKNGKVLASNTDSYLISDKSEDNGLKLALRYSHKGWNAETYSVIGGKETRNGVKLGYAFKGIHKARKDCKKN